MKILLIQNYPKNPGGEKTVVEQETALLRDHNHQVINYIRSNDEIDALGRWQKMTLPKRAIWASDAMRDIRGLIQREKPDVAHIHNTHFMISPGVFHICQEMRLPVVQTLHNYRLLCPDSALLRKGHVCEECVGKAI